MRPRSEFLAGRGDDGARPLVVDDGDDGTLDGQPGGRSPYTTMLSLPSTSASFMPVNVKVRGPAGLPIPNAYVGWVPHTVVDPGAGGRTRKRKFDDYDAGRALPGRRNS